MDVIVKNLLEVNLRNCSIAWGFGANYISACVNDKMNITFFQFIDTDLVLNMEQTSVSFQTNTYSSFALIAKKISVNVMNSSALFYNYETKLNAVYNFECSYVEMNIDSFDDTITTNASHIKLLTEKVGFHFDKFNIYMNNTISGIYSKEVYFNKVYFFFGFEINSINISHFETKKLNTISAKSNNMIGNWYVYDFHMQSSILNFTTLYLYKTVDFEIDYAQQQFISCQELHIFAPNFNVRYLFGKNNIAEEDKLHKRYYIMKVVTLVPHIPLDNIKLIPVAVYDKNTVIENADKKFSTLHIKQSPSKSEIYYVQNYNLGWAISYYCYGFCSPGDEPKTILTDDTINIWRDRISEVTKIVKIEIVTNLQILPVFDVTDLKYRNFTLSVYCHPTEFCNVKLICDKPKIPLKIEVENLILQLTDFGDESSFSLINGSLNDIVDATRCKEITTNLEYVNQFLITSKTNMIVIMPNKNYMFSFCGDMV
ncbi:hypothetical protein TVAG_257280 [Trichomonas vaginalis G3]|uniref:Uncharacterized protein n=1 Tax=Trichomonas vaginalis (strain ATCC PRA-98 / G3) TaxID=412133 RepID=A2ELG2_TRIV3|nr:hypothetical protein TVAGG3_0005450 [Trichomonas vaginalis G3]EAY06489.1 hypothetical protein TVAG_257280 [Trichomonas vaginalis G3]KAI5538879.1 hypothetical protein TVAGG3_0005450 [Trichomonas vaginalis G3]|eukprot:XP_001318712.1 hypothetical protein [Trichomonas vaginalis G3]